MAESRDKHLVATSKAHAEEMISAYEVETVTKFTVFRHNKRLKEEKCGKRKLLMILNSVM
jgi:hypothetical protein